MIAYILTDLYPPAFAPRIAAMVKYLKDYGLNIFIFTEKQKEHLIFSNHTDECPTFRFSLVTGGNVKRQLSKFMELIFQCKERNFRQHIDRVIDKSKLPKPDIVISFCYRKFPLNTAYKLSKKYGVPFIADCRDIIEQYKDFLPKPIKLFGFRARFIERIVGKIFIHQRNKVLKKADAITTVSKWHRTTLEGITKKKVELIYNGYDDSLFFRSKEKTNNSFDIVFTGRLIDIGLRNPSILLEVAKELQEKCPLLKLHFYTDDNSSEIIKFLNTDINCNTLEIKNMVDYADIPDILNSSSIIALISNSAEDNGAKGMISTKIFEALAMCRPILLFPDDTSEAADIIRQSGRGIASKNKSEIKDFILDNYTIWQKTSRCIVQGDEKYISKFNRRSQAKAMADIIYRLVK